MSEKLQKILARAGFGSRRHNESLIAAGRVTVNGQVATLGDRADARSDDIAVDGRHVTFESPIYIMLHKPRNVLSSTEDELSEGRKTVRDLVSVKGHLYPVGRLDRESLGLILLTNDGQMAHRLTHPRYEHPKVYRVLVEGHPQQEVLSAWRHGINLDGKRTLPCKVKYLRRKEDATWLRVTMREGRKRQIRRVASALGHPVRTLIRSRLGPLQLGDLPQGHWRYLTDSEVRALRKVTSTVNKRESRSHGGGAGTPKRSASKRSQANRRRSGPDHAKRNDRKR